MATRKRTGSESYLAAFSFGGMPYSEVENSMKLFAEKVMPRLKEVPSAA